MTQDRANSNGQLCVRTKTPNVKPYKNELWSEYFIFSFPGQTLQNINRQCGFFFCKICKGNHLIIHFSVKLSCFPMHLFTQMNTEIPPMNLMYQNQPPKYSFDPNVDIRL